MSQSPTASQASSSGMGVLPLDENFNVQPEAMGAINQSRRGRFSKYVSMAKRYPGRAAALGAGALGATAGLGLGGAYLLGYGRGVTGAPVIPPPPSPPQGIFTQATEAVGNKVLNFFAGAKNTAVNAAEATGQFIANNPYTAGAIALGATGATALGARAAYNGRQMNSSLKVQQLQEAISLTGDATADLISQSAAASRSLGSSAAQAAFTDVVRGAAYTDENLSQAAQALRNHYLTGNPSDLVVAERFVDAAIAGQQAVERASERISQSAVAARKRKRTGSGSGKAVGAKRASSSLGRKGKSTLQRRATASGLARKQRRTSRGSSLKKKRRSAPSRLMANRSGQRRTTTSKPKRGTSRGRNSRNTFSA